MRWQFARQHFARVDVLQKTHAATIEELAEAKAQCIILAKVVAAYRVKDEFVEYMGAAFRKNPAGGYISAVYCPNCLKQVGSGFDDFPYHCGSCGWNSRFEGREIDRIIKALP